MRDNMQMFRWVAGASEQLALKSNELSGSSLLAAVARGPGSARLGSALRSYIKDCHTDWQRGRGAKGEEGEVIVVAVVDRDKPVS